MITQTELNIHGWCNNCDEGEMDYFFSPSGNVSVYPNHEKMIHVVHFYQDHIDEEGELCSMGVFELIKPYSLTIDELLQFTKFIDE